MDNDEAAWSGSETRIEPSTINRRVYERLCTLLVQGRWGLGQRLDERTLSAQLGVSRTPLREAIGRLVSEGVIDHRPYQGNFVRTFTPKQVHDLFEVRKSLEGLAAREATEQATPPQIALLRAIVNRCHLALDAGDVALFESADREFHDAILRFANNEVLTFSLRLLNLHIQLVRHLANAEPNLRESTREHRTGVVEAFEAGNADEAARRLVAHITEVQESVMRQVAADGRKVAAPRKPPG